MALEPKKSRVAGRIWQAMTQSGVDLSTMPRDELEKLVDYIAEGVLVEFDALLEEVELPAQTRAAQVLETGTFGDEEQVLWEGRPFLSLVERYVITNQRVRIITGLVGRDHEDIELIRIKDVQHTQGVGERIMNMGDVVLHSGDASQPHAVLHNVTDPEQVHEIIRRAVLEARKQNPFHFQQEM